MRTVEKKRGMRSRHWLGSILAVSVASLAGACGKAVIPPLGGLGVGGEDPGDGTLTVGSSQSSSSSGAGPSSVSGAVETTATSASSGGGGGAQASSGSVSGSSGNAGGSGACATSDNEDKDKDGWTPADGDCNDCDPSVNPNAVEIIAFPDGDGGVPVAIDEDCDGKVDNVAPSCDDVLDVAEPNAMGAAWAVDLCKKSTGPKIWGVTEAQWVLPDGSPPPGGAGTANFHLGHGILPGFGPNVKVQSGARLLALSSGTARQPTDPGYQDVAGFSKGYNSAAPMGFPKESPACPGTITGQPTDGAGVEVTIRTPSNAHGFSFDFDFFTYEWPNFICSTYNDFFVAILSPIPAGLSDGNIAFDGQNNPVSVNNALLDVCGCAPSPPCGAGGKTFACALGDQALVGTGFSKTDGAGMQDHGSTYWLRTTAPVAPNGEIIIRWGVYDSGDGILDTTTLVDNWQWITTPGMTVGTSAVPDPK